MVKRLLLVAAWLMPALIIVLGINTGSTIWYYMEPQIDSLAEPASYYVAAFSGIAVLALSVLLAVEISIYVATVKAEESAVV